MTCAKMNLENYLAEKNIVSDGKNTNLSEDSGGKA